MDERALDCLLGETLRLLRLGGKSRERSNKAIRLLI